MVYVNSDGSIVDKAPFTSFKWFWGLLNFFYYLFQTLVNPNFNKHGNKYVTDFRPPGSGPPKPPTRKYGGFGPSSSGPSPPPTGGCGCG
ncbi:selenoprotein K-like [Pieris napi]|uniref:Selenoprotein K n=1 Tax=Pieris macdunnoughi TaxID=345717 RepID=A0A821L0S2_9NEOP|nr:selenoprotein K-like [Pieris napi]CAF4743675.1 unnamed protein product [Pieris macdunnoughi]